MTKRCPCCYDLLIDTADTLLAMHGVFVPILRSVRSPPNPRIVFHNCKNAPLEATSIESQQGVPSELANGSPSPSDASVGR